MLTGLSIHNYKSVRDINLSHLPAFSVLVGANAAGKSNFVDALDFLSLAFRTGLSTAVRTKGGYENICFRRGKRSKGGLKFGLKATVTEPQERARDRRGPRFVFEYDFTFGTTTQQIAAEYEVLSERLALEIEYDPPRQRNQLTITRKRNETPEIWHQLSEKDKHVIVPPVDFLERWLERLRVPQDELILTTMLGHLEPFSLLVDLMSRCGVYQVSPYVARETGIPERSPELGRHGENLPAAVRYLQTSEHEAFEELLAHVSHTVPAIEALVTDYVETKQLGLFFKETGVGRRWFSQDVSDGTIQTVGIFLPLVDPRIRILAIEEPENSLHPWILRHFMDSCKSHSTDKQIFVTTQSLVAVNQTPLESLYLVLRHKGETEVIRCIERNPELKQVISEQLMGLGEYWDSGAMSALPEYGDQLRLVED